LTFAYQSYLSEFDEKKLEVDGFTESVANQSSYILSLINADSYTMPNLKEASVNLFYNNLWVARIVEGCNAISVLILFISFVLAFTGKFKQTVFFIIIGSLIIHVFNVLRIVLLSISIYHYPKYKEVLHSVIFPLFIYGIVFLLWIIWVNKYSFYAKNNTKK
jgi:exosortase family protein XrtF